MIRAVALFAVLTLSVGWATASAATLALDAGVLDTFQLSADVAAPLAASVDLRPEAIPDTSKAGPLRAHVEFPAALDPAGIVLDSVRLCPGTLPCAAGIVPLAAPDVDGERLIFRFDRAAVLALARDADAMGNVAFTLSGVVDPPGRMFAGTDAITILDTGKPDHADESEAEPAG